MSCDEKYGQIMFFKKNKMDLENPNIEMSVLDATAINDGLDYLPLLRNRNNVTGWATTGSNDAANTQITVNFQDERYINDLFLVEHNFADFQVEYWTGLTWQDFPSAINVTGNTETTNYFTLLNTYTTMIRLTITGTMTPDDDKYLAQIIATERLGVGQLDAWPEIKSPTHSTQKKVTRMLSGRAYVTESTGAFSTTLTVKYWKSIADLQMVESMYFGREGFLMWLSGGDEAQFHFAAQGYRLQDIYLVRPTNEYKPEWYKSWYNGGLKISMRLEETIT